MSATVFAQVVGAIVARLQAHPPVSAHVFRARMRAFPASALTGLCVRIGRVDIQQGVGQGVPRIAATGIALECYARASASDSIDEALDGLLQSAATRLLADPSLGGLVGDINPTGIAYDFDADGEATACAVISFDVVHATPVLSF